MSAYKMMNMLIDRRGLNPRCHAARPPAAPGRAPAPFPSPGRCRISRTGLSICGGIPETPIFPVALAGRDFAVPHAVQRLVDQGFVHERPGDADDASGVQLVRVEEYLRLQAFRLENSRAIAAPAVAWSTEWSAYLATRPMSCSSAAATKTSASVPFAICRV